MVRRDHRAPEALVLGVALASGSNGNSFYVETADARLLVDAGVSGRTLEARARERGASLEGVDAVLLSHGHHDHVSGAGVVARRFSLPVFASAGTWGRVEGKLGRVAQTARFRPGETLSFGRTRVHTLPTPHDVAGSAAFVVESEGRRLGILTDLGCPFPELVDLLGTLDGAFLESNYDPDMLATGPYPWHLKERIAGPGGHLSNEECAKLVTRAGGARLRTVVLSHLSGNCNTPERALDRARRIGEVGVEVQLAPRDGPSPWVDLRD